MPDAPGKAAPLEAQLRASPALAWNHARSVETGINLIVELVQITSAESFGLQDIEDAVAVALRQGTATEEAWQPCASRDEGLPILDTG